MKRNNFVNTLSIASAILAIGATFSTTTYAAPAIIITDFGCGLLDGNGGFAFTTDTKTVITNDANGNTILKCKATGLAHPGGAAVHWDFSNTSIPCGTFLGGTTDWKEVVTSSGNATLTCKIVPNPTP